VKYLLSPGHPDGLSSGPLNWGSGLANGALKSRLKRFRLKAERKPETRDHE